MVGYLMPVPVVTAVEACTRCWCCAQGDQILRSARLRQSIEKKERTNNGNDAKLDKVAQILHGSVGCCVAYRMIRCLLLLCIESFGVYY